MVLSKRNIRIALDKGIDWLLGQQLPDGSWRADFGFRHGPASSWSTAYVANRLPAEVNTKELQHRIKSFLLNNHVYHQGHNYGQGWGYNELTPPDLDTTIEVLRCIGEEVSRSATATSILACIKPDGGLATYTESDARKVIPSSVRPNGWTSSHLEIATNALQWATATDEETDDLLQLRTHLSSHIISTVRASGYQCYWYPCPIIAAAQVLRSLNKGLPNPPLPRNPSRLDWETRHNPFVTAHALEVAVRWEKRRYRKIIEHLASDLVSLQKPDGSWRPCHVLRVPYPDETDPRMVQHTNADYKCPIVTVAAVIASLSLLLSTN